ncbi:MAG: hypothetical protein AB202_00830 [Parcubacteria bacterium C7867-007]|nr:MAG: hypothetical protein AB202_00830 [Parcubacteria bacterium C7867-007]
MTALTLTQQCSAIKLYQGGMSAPMIAKHFLVSTDAIYYTLRHHNIPRRSPSMNSAIWFAAKPLSYELKKHLTYSEEQLKLAAIMLYWAEGYKVGKQTCVDFTNSDPDMLVVFLRFLREICRVDSLRIRAAMYCYEDQNVIALTQFWSELLSIPENQFTKPYVKKQVAPGRQGPRMIHGLVHIRYCDKKLLRQILNWIDEYRAECVGGRVVNYTTL